MFHKILIANRGEIAVRVINACREMGIKTVAVYSDADRASLHVLKADEAYHIGPPSPLESYLNQNKIIEVCKRACVDAVHPGYGFLSENTRFAGLLKQNNITFIGPNPTAIELMGDKIGSRKIMEKALVPLVPGMTSKSESLTEIAAFAEKIGFPVLIKASAGGGGKGMKIVEKAENLKDAVESAQREALKAFGDDTVYVEKLLLEPRHIEFQILGDKHGNYHHLFERECSIQRRYQKVIEETPSTALTPELRNKMGEVAVQAARSVAYDSVGTVEFLLDKDGSFYFLEMNTRIQVEHPITEMVTGVDLVKTQILIAAGEKLNLDGVTQKGHAIECRVYAEDPANNFLPSSGKILFMKEPAGLGVRNDCGVYSGATVTVHYDPILSKLVVWGEDREAARKKMLTALDDYVVLGIKTSIPFLRDCLKHDAFIKGRTYTDFIPKNMGARVVQNKHHDKALCAAVIHAHAPKQAGVKQDQVLTPWQTIGNWEIAGR
ncbi:MAG: acetyl-CoA carboxylase biotin carboxylase subunit [Deltaproteobacteria bacterium]|nr:acetyl-CoA carboxylase biotin carboxylase subunit [Deltaproteobacteria bacterium]